MSAVKVAWHSRGMAALKRGKQRRVTNELRLRRAVRGSGEHRRKRYGTCERCQVRSKRVASAGARTRRRRNS